MQGFFCWQLLLLIEVLRNNPDDIYFEMQKPSKST